MREQQLRRTMNEQGIDALLVTTPQNVFYLTGYRVFGFTHFESFAILPADAAEPALVTGHFGLLQVAGACDRPLRVFTFDDTHFNAVFPTDLASPVVPWPTARERRTNAWPPSSPGPSAPAPSTPSTPLPSPWTPSASATPASASTISTSPSASTRTRKSTPAPSTPAPSSSRSGSSRPPASSPP